MRALALLVVVVTAVVVFTLSRGSTGSSSEQATRTLVPRAGDDETAPEARDDLSVLATESVREAADSETSTVVEAGPVEGAEPAGSAPAIEPIEDGVVLTGTIITTNDETLTRAIAVLEFELPGRDRPFLSPIDVTVEPDGRFQEAVRGKEDWVTVSVGSPGVGAAPDQRVLLQHGTVVDLGELTLMSSGGIVGRAVFPNGDAVPDLSLSAMSTEPRATPGLRKGKATTDPEGRFEIQGLAPGSFRFEATGEEDLPILGADVLQCGDRTAELVIDASLVRMTCVDDSGTVVRMKSISVATAPTDDGGDEGASSSSRGSSAGWERFEFLVPTGRSFVLQATGEDRRPYFALLPAGRTPGVLDVAMTSDAPGFGALEVVVLGLDGEDVPRLGRLERDGHDVMSPVLSSKDDALNHVLMVKGLLPGDYELRMPTDVGEWSALAEPAHSFEITAGGHRRIEVTAFHGGRFELIVGRTGVDSATLAAEKPVRQARVRILAPGESEWAWAGLVSRRPGGGTVHGARLFMDRTPARSNVLRPGSYRVQIDAEGLDSVEREVEVSAGHTTEVRLEIDG